jgi:hypothetical protein
MYVELFATEGRLVMRSRQIQSHLGEQQHSDNAKRNKKKWKLRKQKLGFYDLSKHSGISIGETIYKPTTKNNLSMY